jgi:glutamyl-tRNA synthetase
MGGVRTALFNYLFARGASGTFVLRIEDTDRERSTTEYEGAIFEDLAWLGLVWDEGPVKGGGPQKPPRGPYRQSERAEIYDKYARSLLSDGHAYKCYCTRERLAELKAGQKRAGLPPRYDGRCRELNGPGEGSGHVIRFRVPEGAVEFTDGVHGPVAIDAARAGGDFIIISSGGSGGPGDTDARPTYNFAAAVDDALMGITHVIRGDDHLSNTPGQILLLRALGMDEPLFFHLPLVLGPERSPLKKRDPSSTVRALREGGYLPEALVNSAARLGWALGKGAEGLMGLDELARRFKDARLSKSPSVFDMKRLDRFNREAIAGETTEALVDFAVPLFKGTDRAWLTDAVEAVRGELTTLKDIESLLKPFIEYEQTDAAREVLSGPEARAVLAALAGELRTVDRLDAENYRSIMESLMTSGLSGRKLLMPVRAALTGRTSGIELEKVFTLLGREKVMERLSSCIA